MDEGALAAMRSGAVRERDLHGAQSRALPARAMRHAFALQLRTQKSGTLCNPNKNAKKPFAGGVITNPNEPKPETFMSLWLQLTSFMVKRLSRVTQPFLHLVNIAAAGTRPSAVAPASAFAFLQSL